MTIEEIIKYWKDSAEKDRLAMLHLFEKEDFAWSLFIGHLFIEKLLKAYYVLNRDKQTPFIHDLLRLAEKSGLNLSEGQKDLLDTVTTFNIRARYDDYKMEFQKKCTPEFTQEYILKIQEFAQWIKQKL